LGSETPTVLAPRRRISAIAASTAAPTSASMPAPKYSFGMPMRNPARGFAPAGAESRRA
jgi:hypothetical protein